MYMYVHVHIIQTYILYTFIHYIHDIHYTYLTYMYMYISMEFNAFSRPPKKPAKAGFFSPHNFLISLRGLYIGLIY